jgi:hypothetical protein
VLLQVDAAGKKERALTADYDAIAPVLAVQFAATCRDLVRDEL